MKSICLWFPTSSESTSNATLVVGRARRHRGLDWVFHGKIAARILWCADISRVSVSGLYVIGGAAAASVAADTQ